MELPRNCRLRIKRLGPDVKAKCLKPSSIAATSRRVGDLTQHVLSQPTLHLRILRLSICGIKRYLTCLPYARSDADWDAHAEEETWSCPETVDSSASSNSA